MIDCHLCERVCPILNQGSICRPLKVYAAKNPNEEIRMNSSSGGIFTVIAERIINKGGVVFGAKFTDKWEVVHDYTQTREGIAAFRGSKYVQSIIGVCYHEAETFLKQGREVLFTGTPCQIAGLKRYLRIDYANLLTVDVVCHGAPSPLIWRDYLNNVIRNKERGSFFFPGKEKAVIKSISFRDKSTGWKNYSFVIKTASSSKEEEDKVLMSETMDKNVFMRGFLSDLYLRPPCYACPSNRGKSNSDITIADYWGISNRYPYFDDNKGTSLILVNNNKGYQLYTWLNLDSIETSYQEALLFNPSIENSVKLPKAQSLFWKTYKIVGIASLRTMLTLLDKVFIVRSFFNKNTRLI